MFLLCKKDVVDSENVNVVLYTAGKKYEAKIIEPEDLLAKDNTGEFALIGISQSQRERLGIEVGESEWGSWFNEHFELIP